MPPGNPDGGPWVSISGGWEQEANARSRAARDWPGASPGQQARLVASQSYANYLTSQVRARDPSWQPGAGISANTIEGAIGRANAVAREAQMRLIELDGPKFGREIDRLVRTETGGVGWRTSGAGIEVRTVGRSHFDDIAGELLHGSVPLSPPSGYNGVWFRRYDGEFGIRMSRDHGPTVDLQSRNTDRFGIGKIHQK